MPTDSTTPVSDGNWAEYKRLVLSELERLNTGISGLQKSIIDCRDEMQRSIVASREETQKAIAACNVEIGMLKVKASIWGIVGGSIPAAIAILFMLVKG